MVVVQLPRDPAADAAEEVLLDIIASKGGRYESKTLLYKAFYLAHLFYWEQHEGVLTKYPIVKMPQGPGIDDGDLLIQHLINRDLISREIERKGPYRCEVYALKAPREINPDNPQQMAVRAAVDFLDGKSASEASAWIHEFSRSWQAAGSGEQLDIYLDVLTDEEYAQVQQASVAAGRLVRDVFG